RSNIELIPLVVDIQSGEVVRLAAADEPAQYVPGPWKHDGSGYWMLTDKGQEFAGLAFVDAKTGEMQWVEQPEWDIEGVAASKDGRFLAWSVNENGYSKLHLRSLESGNEIDLPELPGGVLKGGLVFSPDGGKLALLMETPVQPAEIYLIDLEAGT